MFRLRSRLADQALLKWGWNAGHRSCQAASKATSDVRARRDHHFSSSLHAGFRAITDSATRIRSCIRQKESLRKPPMVGTPGGRTIYCNQRHAKAANWRRLEAKSFGRPVVGGYRRLRCLGRGGGTRRKPRRIFIHDAEPPKGQIFPEGSHRNARIASLRSAACKERSEAAGCEARTMHLWQKAAGIQSASWMRRDGRDTRVDRQ